MIKEGVLEGEYAPGAIFGLHVFPGPTGGIMYKPDGMMAAADGLAQRRAAISRGYTHNVVKMVSNGL